MKMTVVTLMIVIALFFVPSHGFAQPRPVADIGQVVIPVVALATAAILKDKEGIGDLAKSLVVAMAATYGLKYAVDAERPNGGSHSFPSAHTAAAFTGATFMWRRYNRKLGFPAIVAATLVVSSRVDTQDHRVVDVVVGAGIAVASVFAFTSRRVDIAPVALRRGGGILVSLNLGN